MELYKKFEGRKLDEGESSNVSPLSPELIREIAFRGTRTPDLDRLMRYGAIKTRKTRAWLYIACVALFFVAITLVYKLWFTNDASWLSEPVSEIERYMGGSALLVGSVFPIAVIIKQTKTDRERANLAKTGKAETYLLTVDEKFYKKVYDGDMYSFEFFIRCENMVFKVDMFDYKKIKDKVIIAVFHNAEETGDFKKDVSIALYPYPPKEKY